MHDTTHGMGINNSFKLQAKKTAKRVYSRATRGKGAGWARGSGRGSCVGCDLFHRMIK